MDYQVNEATPGESDLAPIVLRKNSAGGVYRITYDPGVQLWATPDKSATKIDGNSVSRVTSGMTFSATHDTTLYVEGTGVGSGKISLAWNPLAPLVPLWIPVDAIKETVFQIAGAQYVPGLGNYTYTASVPGGASNNAAWNFDNGSGTLAEGPSSTSLDVTFAAGPAIGKVVYSPAVGFQGIRKVYVVEVSVDAGTVSKPPPRVALTIQNGDFRLASRYSITWSNNVTLLGPTDPITGNQRGLPYIQVGYMQTVNVSAMNAMYGDVKIHNPAEGGTYIDMVTDNPPNEKLLSAWPWADSNKKETATLPDNAQFHANGLMQGSTADKPANTPQTDTLSEADLPGTNVPQTWNGTILSSAIIQSKFNLRVAVRTLDPATSSNDEYFQEADAQWRLDYSGRAVPPIRPGGPNGYHFAVGQQLIDSDDKTFAAGEGVTGVVLSLPSLPAANQVANQPWVPVT